MAPNKTQWERFFEKVDKNGPGHPYEPELGQCWIWTGSRREYGHGYFWFDNSVKSAHQFSWLAAGYELIDGLEICHSCDRGWCQNPDHLVQGTHKQNFEHMAKKERGTSILTAEKVRTIREMWRQLPRPKVGDIASLFSVSKGAICGVIYHRNWKHVQ